MKKSEIEAIARWLSYYDKGDTTYYQGGFASLGALLDDLGYTFIRTPGKMNILDSSRKIVCSVPS